MYVNASSIYPNTIQPPLVGLGLVEFSLVRKIFLGVLLLMQAADVLELVVVQLLEHLTSLGTGKVVAKHFTTGGKEARVQHEQTRNVHRKQGKEEQVTVRPVRRVDPGPRDILRQRGPDELHLTEHTHRVENHEERVSGPHRHVRRGLQNLVDIEGVTSHLAQRPRKDHHRVEWRVRRSIVLLHDEPCNDDARGHLDHGHKRTRLHPAQEGVHDLKESQRLRHGKEGAQVVVHGRGTVQHFPEHGGVSSIAWDRRCNLGMEKLAA